MEPPDRSWLRLRLAVPPEMAEAAATILGQVTGGGIELGTDPVSAQELVIGYLALPAGDNNTLTVPSQVAELQKHLAAMHLFFPGTMAPELQMETIPEQDWGSGWKKFFTPLHITPTLVIKPTWEEYHAGTGEQVIEMDPGLAFGTGHHASTRLALLLIESALASRPQPAATALDLGCGTGILAMACALYGVRQVLAVDNDPDAVTATRENITRNNLTDRVSAALADAAVTTGTYDLVVANIIHDVLVGLAGSLVRLLRPGGALVLAGILAGSQTESIAAAYTGCGLVHDETRIDGEWSALRFTRP